MRKHWLFRRSEASFRRRFLSGLLRPAMLVLVAWAISPLSSTVVLSSSLYKWVDEDGRVHYSTKPPRVRNAAGVTKLDSHDISGAGTFERDADAYTSKPLRPNLISKGRLIATLRCRNQREDALAVSGGAKNFDTSDWLSVRYYRNCLGSQRNADAVELRLDPGKLINRAKTNPTDCEIDKIEILEFTIAYLRDGRIDPRSNLIDPGLCAVRD